MQTVTLIAIAGLLAAQSYLTGQAAAGAVVGHTKYTHLSH